VAVVRIHRYSVDPADFDELIVRRAALVDAMRTKHPGLAETRLIKLDDSTYIETWRWDSAEQMEAALEDAPSFPEVAAAMSLVRDRSAEDGEIVDER